MHKVYDTINVGFIDIRHERQFATFAFFFILVLRNDKSEFFFKRFKIYFFLIIRQKLLECRFFIRIRATVGILVPQTELETSATKLHASFNCLCSGMAKYLKKKNIV